MHRVSQSFGCCLSMRNPDLRHSAHCRPFTCDLISKQVSNFLCSLHHFTQAIGKHPGLRKHSWSF